MASSTFLDTLPNKLEDFFSLSALEIKSLPDDQDKRKFLENLYTDPTTTQKEAPIYYEKKLESVVDRIKFDKQIYRLVNTLQQWIIETSNKENPLSSEMKQTIKTQWDKIKKHFRISDLSKDMVVAVATKGKLDLETLVYETSKPMANKDTILMELETLSTKLDVCVPGFMSTLDTVAESFSTSKNDILHRARKMYMQQMALDFIRKERKEGNPIPIGNEIHYVAGLLNSLSAKMHIRFENDPFITNFSKAKIQEFASLLLKSPDLIKNIMDELVSYYDNMLRGVDSYEKEENFFRKLNLLGPLDELGSQYFISEKKEKFNTKLIRKDEVKSSGVTADQMTQQLKQSIYKRLMLSGSIKHQIIVLDEKENCAIINFKSTTFENKSSFMKKVLVANSKDDLLYVFQHYQAKFENLIQLERSPTVASLKKFPKFNHAYAIYKGALYSIRTTPFIYFNKITLGELDQAFLGELKDINEKTLPINKLLTRQMLNQLISPENLKRLRNMTKPHRKTMREDNLYFVKPSSSIVLKIASNGKTLEILREFKDKMPVEEKIKIITKYTQHRSKDILHYHSDSQFIECRVESDTDLTVQNLALLPLEKQFEILNKIPPIYKEIIENCLFNLFETCVFRQERFVVNNLLNVFFDKYSRVFANFLFKTRTHSEDLEVFEKTLFCLDELQLIKLASLTNEGGVSVKAHWQKILERKLDGMKATLQLEFLKTLPLYLSNKYIERLDILSAWKNEDWKQLNACLTMDAEYFNKILLKEIQPLMDKDEVTKIFVLLDAIENTEITNKLLITVLDKEPSVYERFITILGKNIEQPLANKILSHIRYLHLDTIDSLFNISEYEQLNSFITKHPIIRKEILKLKDEKGVTVANRFEKQLVNLAEKHHFTELFALIKYYPTKVPFQLICKQIYKALQSSIEGEGQNLAQELLTWDAKFLKPLLDAMNLEKLPLLAFIATYWKNLYLLNAFLQAGLNPLIKHGQLDFSQALGELIGDFVLQKKYESIKDFLKYPVFLSFISEAHKNLFNELLNAQFKEDSQSKALKEIISLIDKTPLQFKLIKLPEVKALPQTLMDDKSVPAMGLFSDQKNAYYYSLVKSEIGNPTFFATEEEKFSWKNIYDKHIFAFKAAKEKIKEVKESDLVTGYDASSEIKNNVGYLCLISKVDFSLAVAVSEGLPSISRSIADRVAKLLKHPCMSYNLARCLGYIYKLSSGPSDIEWLEGYAKKILDICKNHFSNDRTKALINTWLDDADAEYNKYPMVIRRDFYRITTIMERYEKNKTFDVDLSTYADWELQMLVHHMPDKILDIGNEAIKRALIDPDKSWIVANVMGHCPIDTKKNKIKELFEAAKSVPSSGQKFVSR